MTDMEYADHVLRRHAKRIETLDTQIYDLQQSVIRLEKTVETLVEKTS